MKKINLYLLAVVLTITFLLGYNWKYGNETFVFFGLAENKETEIRLESPVIIDAVNVSAGSKVAKGDVILEATRSSLELATSDLNHEVAALKSQYKIWESSLKGSIQSLKAQKTARQSEIQSQIDQLESKMSINESLAQGLESITPARGENVRSPGRIRIEGLKKEMDLVVKPLEAEIRKLEQELYGSKNPLKIQIEKLENELGYVHQQEENLIIYAPSDGVIGSIFCKVGEQLPSFTTLITFYEENPTQVKSYVLESLLLNISMGDSIIVQSGVQLNTNCVGAVIGMGSRIVEIPERLRKNPDFKTYGREIQIAIPSNNTFLQKEKVILKRKEEKG
ncbi:HlyD family secretion protein [Neolewinella agarilytica]|uniref:Multidrug resistance efflux pump n=1 Tax=Neolewinella agarilytica TaxID=478744 RepID=A0A1H9HGN3_9BACT|nr:hypothetical protein [Neolewinella agarilytica]SEQ61489.1 Multidrug resistance efflux pump [Neolewinella agarilytica]